jgi:hypothetical protein
MGDTLERPTKDFTNAASVKAVAVHIPVELVEYYKSVYERDWQAQIIGDLGFFVDSHKQRQEQVGRLFPLPEPGEMDEPAGPAPNAPTLDA